MRKANRVILVTGSGSGIGLASARAFLEIGDRIIVSDTTLDKAEAAAHALGGDAFPVAMDVTDESSVEQGFALALAEAARIDVLHANAGVSSMKRAVNLELADWDFNFDVNAKGVFLTNRAAVRQFLEQGDGGVIVNTASLAAKVGAPLLAHYSASKFAVLGWTQALAREHGRDGIRVNAVCPGFVATPMLEREIAWEAELTGMTPDGVRASYVAQTPLGRLTTPEDVADVVTFLASDRARFMTGQGVNVTGGVYMG